MTQRAIMAIGAHADDIEIYAGGTCLKYHDIGYTIHYVMSTNNMSGRLHRVEKDLSVTRLAVPAATIEPLRKQECLVAAAQIGAVPVHLDHPQRHYTDENLNKVAEGYGVPPPPDVTLGRPVIMMAHQDSESVARVTRLILEENPEAILTHPLITVSPEHYGTAMLVLKAWRAAAQNGYEGPLLFWNEFKQKTALDPSFLLWDAFIDISGLRQRQYDWIRCHITMIPFPERMDYLDFTPLCGVRDAELYKCADTSTPLRAVGDFTAELLRNVRTSA